MKLPKLWKRAENNYYYVEIDGKQHRLARDKKEAKTLRDELLEQHGLKVAVAKLQEQGSLPAAVPAVRNSQVTLHELIGRYKKWMKKELAASTNEMRGYVLDTLLEVTDKDLLAEDFTPSDVDDWIDGLNARSPSTRRDRIDLVKWVYKYGKKQKLIYSNPVEDMQGPAPRVRQECLAPDQFQSLFDAVPNEQLREFLAVMLESGCRTQEMFKMEAKYLQKDRIVFPIEESKGRKRSRVIYLPPTALAIIQRLAAEHPEGPIFRNTLGRPWNKNSINNHMRRLKKKLGIQSLCATTMRHSFAHARLIAGQDSTVVAKLMGHVNTNMINRRYGHLEGTDYLAKKANETPVELPAVEGPELGRDEEDLVTVGGGDDWAECGAMI